MSVESTVTPLDCVTEIVRNAEHKLPERAANYLMEKLENVEWSCEKAHNPSSYKPEKDPNWNDYCCHVGVFFDFLIRREIHMSFGKEPQDQTADNLLTKFTKSSSDFSKDDRKLLGELLESYKSYKNVDCSSKDILKDIFNTAMLHFYNINRNKKNKPSQVLPYTQVEKFVNGDDVDNVLVWIDKEVRSKELKFDQLRINPNVSCQFFKGFADVIIDDILCEFKVSQYKWSTELDFKSATLQLLLYALGHYAKPKDADADAGSNANAIKKFMIYNPLKGFTYRMEVADLDFVKFSDYVAGRSSQHEEEEAREADVLVDPTADALAALSILEPEARSSTVDDEPAVDVKKRPA